MPDTIFSQPFDPKTTRIRVTPGDRCGLFRESDTIKIETAGNAPVRVMNLRGGLLREGRSLSLVLPRGHYFVETDGDRTQFAVLPDDYRGASFLGTEADNGTDGQLAAKLRQVQPAWVRVMDAGCYWPDVQPQPNRWDWARADRTIAANQVPGRRVVVMAFVRPTWQTNDAEFIPKFTEYTKRLAQRYDGKIYGIEIWNEPCAEGGFANRVPIQGHDWKELLRFYVELVRASRAAIKSIAPGLKVFGPAWQNSYWSDATAEFVEMGGLPLVDTYTFHDYEMSQSPPDDDKRFSESVVVSRLDKRIAAHRRTLGNVPIHVNEVGLFGKSALGCPNTSTLAMYLSNYDWRRGMSRAIKAVVLYRCAGVEAITPHVLGLYSEFPNDNYQIFGWDYSGNDAMPRGPHPKTSAFLMSCYWLNGARFVGQRIIDGKVYLSGWMRSNDRPLVFVWCREGQSVSLRETGSFRVTDVFGSDSKVRSLGEEPLLFHGSADTSATNLLDTVAEVISR